MRIETRHWFPVALAAAFLWIAEPLAAQETPADSVGEAVEESVEATGEAVEEAGEAIEEAGEDAADPAAEQLGEQVEEAGEEIQDAAEEAGEAAAAAMHDWEFALAPTENATSAAGTVKVTEGDPANSFAVEVRGVPVVDSLDQSGRDVNAYTVWVVASKDRVGEAALAGAITVQPDGTGAFQGTTELDTFGIVIAATPDGAPARITGVPVLTGIPVQPAAEDEGPVEEAVEGAADAVEDAADAVGDAAQAVGETVEDAADEAVEELNEETPDTEAPETPDSEAPETPDTPGR